MLSSRGGLESSIRLFFLIFLVNEILTFQIKIRSKAIIIIRDKN